MYEVEEERGLFHRVGAVSHDDADAIVVGQRILHRLDEDPQVGEGEQVAACGQDIGRADLGREHPGQRRGAVGGGGTSPFPRAR